MSKSEVRARKPARDAVRSWVRTGLLPRQVPYDVDTWPPRSRSAAYLLRYLIDHANLTPASAAPVARRVTGLEPLGEHYGGPAGLVLVLGTGVSIMVHGDVLEACHVPPMVPPKAVPGPD